MSARIVAWIAVTFLLLGLAGPAAAAPAAGWDPAFAPPLTVADLTSIVANARPWGVAPGDFDEDGVLDLVVGRTTGNVHFVRGLGGGAFDAPVQFPWKQAYYNAWAYGAGDVNGDGHLDVVWGASAASGPVLDGEVRAFLGNGDGTFQENAYLISGVLHNAGALLADVGTDAGSLAVGDVDADGDPDVIAGGSDGASAGFVYVRLLRNTAGVFAAENIINQAYTTALTAPVYYPAVSTQNSPWGLALGDVDADGDPDLWVGDRALFVYLYLNDGAGHFTLQPPASPPVATRPNALLAHDSLRAAVGYTPALGSADVNGDGRADLVLGLQSGAQTSAVAHDGEVLLHLSTETNLLYGPAMLLADIGMVARGIHVLDVDADGYRDVVAAARGGQVVVLRQLPVLRSVYGWVFVDANEDGFRQDSEQPGLAGVYLTLEQEGTAVAQTISVGDNGWYILEGVPLGDYCLSAAIPPDAVPTSPTKVCFTLGLDGQLVNYGVVPARASIGGTVFYDADIDGIQDPGEAGIPNVTAALWTSVSAAPGAVVGSTTTDADGQYWFGPILPGEYFVQVTDAAGELAGLTLTTPGNPLGPIAVVHKQDYQAADFGYGLICASARGAIAGRVWHDINADGVQDAGETGIKGVTVCAEPLGYVSTYCRTTNTQGWFYMCVPKHTYLVAPDWGSAALGGLTATTREFYLPVVIRPGGRFSDAFFGYR